MNKELVVIDSESNTSTSNENVDFESFNKTNFKSLSKNNHNNIDFGGDSFGNYNDDDYYAEDDYSGGNYYDDSNDFNTKGNVYTDDFTEDYPGINQLYKQKLYKDIRKAYKKDTDDDNGKDKESNNEQTTDNNKNEFDDLNSKSDPFPNFTNNLEDIYFQPGKIIFKAPSPFALKPEIKDDKKFSNFYFTTAICFIILCPTFDFIFLLFFSFIAIFALTIIFINYLIKYIKYIKNHITTNYIILDYEKNLLYYTSHFVLAHSRILFKFEDIVDIGVSYENRETYKASTIYLLLKNGEAFKFKESNENNFDKFYDYSELAKKLSIVFKKHYFDNPHKEKLYKSNDPINGICFTTETESSEELTLFKLD